MQQTQPYPATSLIDPEKIDKYLPKLLNGDLHKLPSWIPTIISSGGIIEREAYDYRTSQLQRKDPNVYNTKLANIMREVEEMKQHKVRVALAFGELKVAVDEYHRKTSKPPLF